ncbi:hypothetical protein GWI33_015861 [Rhynchophorus ferrugineus]|uniref:AB hydrolase-1 domain-containing protein n=1 Tax=Rhynchophorus ferrugineus TaxID=354439 RepID=A0A834I1M0_RHYFE|nr:hypothetical protein GWI33_015861 [Rhynchophorus ferrugineus]
MSLLKSFLKLHCQKQSLRTISNQANFKEVRIPVPWGEVRGKWWGPTDVRPILTFHGWQDNCGSFDRLIPLLNNNVGYLALDLPGHGYSSRLPPGIMYHSLHNFCLVKYVKQYLNWPKISLMGHSMGGITSFTYAMLYPSEIDFVVCIDGVKPLIPPLKKNRLTKVLDEFLKNSKFANNPHEPPSYTIAEMEMKVHLPNQGSINVEYAKYILERNIAPSKLHPGKYYFTRDPRLKADKLGFLSQEEILDYAQNVNFPVFIAKALAAKYYEAKQNVYDVLDVLKRVSPHCEYHYVHGTHHVHLNDPGKELSGLINQFLMKYVTEDRSVGGLREEMIVQEEKLTTKVVQ